jgi:hypothetical protein
VGAESNAVERLSKLMRPARAYSVALLTDIHSREWRRGGARSLSVRSSKRN